MEQRERQLSIGIDQSRNFNREVQVQPSKQKQVIHKIVQDSFQTL